MPAPLAQRTDPYGSVVSALRNAQKSNRNAPAYSRWINRPIGRLFAAAAFKLGMTPNQVTAVSGLVTFTGIGCLAALHPHWWSGLLVGLLLVIGYALDSADGQLARLRGGGSIVGEWLDHVIDSIKTSSFHLAVAVTWFRHLGGWSTWTTLVPLVFALQAGVWFFTIILTDQLERAAGTKVTGATPTAPRTSLVSSVMALGADYGFLSLSMLLLGWFSGWRWLYTALMVFNVLLLLLQLVRWFRRIAALPTR